MCAVAVGCTDLPDLGDCGNGIVEPAEGEDCDDGQPGCNASCRLACLGDGTCRDPGYVCGVDQVCRQGSGTLHAVAEARMDTPLIGLADVDGDGIRDMLGGGHGDLDIVFGSQVSELDRTFRGGLPATPRAEDPIAATQFPPGGAGLAIPTLSGVAFLIAGADGVSAPPVPIYDLGERRVGAVTVAGPLQLVLTRSEQDPTAWLEVVGGAALQFGEPACGDSTPLDEDAVLRSRRLSPTVTQVVVHPGGTTYCLRRQLGGAFGAPQPFPTPSGLEGAWPAQLDTDDCVEIVLDLPFNQVGIADAVEADGCQHTAWAVTAATGGERVIGVDDFDGDGRDEIIVSSLDGTTVESTQKDGPSFDTPRELTIAVAADVNRDGRVDMVGGSAVEPDLTVLLLLADGTYAEHRIPTQLPIAWLASGDVDADTFPDIYTLTTELAPGSLLSVHYGSPTGLLDERLVTPLRGARGIALGRVFGADSFADVMVGHVDARGPVLSQFAGTSSRSPYSPTQLEITPRSHGVLAGDLVAGSGPYPDVAILGTLESGQPGLGTWWLPDLDDFIRRDVSLPIFDDAQDPYTAPVFAAATEPAGPVVFVARRHSVTAGGGGPPTPIAVAVLQPVLGPPFELLVSLEENLIPLPTLSTHGVRRLRGVELDGDPAAELLIAVDERGDETEIEGPVIRRLFVVDRGPDARPAVDLAALLGAAECLDGATVALGADPARPRTLIVVCRGTPAGDGLFVIPDLAQPETATFLALELAGDPVLGAGDINGDQIEDLVVRVGSSGFGRVITVIQCSTSTADPCPSVGMP